MSKLKFGSNTVVPVKDLRNDMVSGLGIDSERFAEGTVAVDGTVIRNIADENNQNLVSQHYGFMASGPHTKMTSYGVGTELHGNEETVIGAGAYANGDYSTAVGSGARAIQQQTVAIGYNSQANGGNAVTVGAQSFTGKSGQIAIGNMAMATRALQYQEGAPGSIVIGNHASCTFGNDTYADVVVGFRRNVGDQSGSSGGNVVIGGMEMTNGYEQYVRPVGYGHQGTFVGYNAGALQRNSYEPGTASRSVAVGAFSIVKSERTIAIGNEACAETPGDIAIGYGARAWNDKASPNLLDASVAIGRDAQANLRSVAVGNQSRAADLGIAMGIFAEASGYHSIAIGAGAKTGENADQSIQLGNQGDASYINTPNTFQVWQYKMLDKDTGLLPKERLSNYIPQNGQVLSYDSSLNCLKWVNQQGGSGGGGTTTLPIASKSNLGVVKIGNGIDVDTQGVISVSTPKTTWGNITGKINNQTDLKALLDAKQNIMQYSEMPTPSKTYQNQVAQYVGGNDPIYNTGNFYVCENGPIPTAHCTSDTQWVNLEVDASRFANFIAKYFYNGELTLVPSKLYRIEYVDQYDGLGWIVYENESSYYVKDIYKMGITAEGAEPSEGDCVYVQLNMNAATGYTWRKLLIDAQVSVNNTLTSTSTKQALSANMGRVLNDKVEQLAGISHFLAMWDTDFGIARYLNTGYQYESGDYFIIAETSPKENTLTPTYEGTGSVEDLEVTDITLFETVYTPEDQTVVLTFNDANKWVDDATEQGFNANLAELGLSYTGTPNVDDVITLVYKTNIQYMPAGTQYSGDSPASRTVTNDPVQISDMYFYDGAHWIFLPSSSRQIAVDEDLDDTSRNPVENRVVTNALNQKLQKLGDENSVYVNDIDGNPTMVSLGAGLGFDWEHYQIVNTRTGGVWGQITGSIENQTDLVNYVASHGGGSGNGNQLLDVFTKEREARKESNEDRYPTSYKGSYLPLYVKLGSDYSTLKASKNDLYITISRVTNANKSKDRRKYRVMNDCNRFKTNKKFYCWRYESANGHYTFDSDKNVWTWTKDEDPIQTDYVYFYTTYDNATDMINADATTWFSPMSTSPEYPMKDDSYRKHYGAWATSFNELEADGVVSDWDNDPSMFTRMPQYDIDTVISLYSNFSGHNRSSEYGFGNVVKNYFTKMACRVYNTPNGKAYFWCNDWTASGKDVYGYYDGDDHLIPNEIPRFMGDLQTFITTEDVFDNPDDFQFVENRSDLNWYMFGESEDFTDVINYLRLSTQDFPDQEDSAGGYMTNWNSYWLDYPIKPIRLADCKIYLYKAPYAEGDSEYAREIASKLAHSYTWEQIEADETLQAIVSKQNDLILELPYDSYYIWMRILGWQKMAFYRRGNEDANVYAEPFERHNLMNALIKTEEDRSWLSQLGKDFGDKYRRQMYQTEFMSYRLQFNTIEGKDLAQNKSSMNHPISRRLTLDEQGGHKLVDQI